MFLKPSNHDVAKPRVQIRNLALLFAIAGGFILTAVLFRARVGHDVYLRWGGLMLTIIVVFGGLVRKSREFYRLRSFWMLVSIFVCSNLVIFGFILSRSNEWKLPWFGFILIEVPIFFVIRDSLQTK
jgi:hypothetical protein